MADLVLQCRGPVGLGQEQEFPVQTLSLLEETGEPAPQKSTLFTATKENLHNRHTQPWKYEYFKSVFFSQNTQCSYFLRGAVKIGQEHIAKCIRVSEDINPACCSYREQVTKESLNRSTIQNKLLTN